MSGNTFGKLFTVTTFGESHGPALGAIVDGCPPGLPLSEADLQHDLDRRRPGSSRHTTQRKEPDQVRILSGVFEGKTTGTSIGLLIENTDQRSNDYSKSKSSFGQRMRITPTTINMATVTTAAVGAPAPVKPLCEWRQGRLPRNIWPPKVFRFAVI